MRATRAISIFITLSLFTASSMPMRAAATETVFDLEGVTKLIDVLDAVMAKNPNFEAETERIETASEAERTAFFDANLQANLVDPEIGRAIDALLATTAYKLYYLKFGNMTPEKHRKMLCDLPYRALPGVAAISSNLKELCEHTAAVRKWVEGVAAGIDPERCRNVAEAWLPEGNYRIPNTYFIYDGNGDAFTAFGSVVFDLFSLIIRDRPVATRFEDLGDTGVEEIERVLAHEYHHIFADRFLYPKDRSFSSWQDRDKDRIVRRIVYEGVAMRCDGRRESQRAVMEDTATVVSWIEELERVFAGLDDGSVSEQGFEKWLGDSYYTAAGERLRDYLVRKYGDEEADIRLARDYGSRPSMIYTLGWWTISRIAASPDGKEAVIGLLSRPYRLFDLYNQTVQEGSEALHIDVSLPMR